MNINFKSIAEYKKIMTRVASGNSMLPSESYTDSEYFKFETEHLFSNSWAAIGFASELAQPGEAKPLMVSGHPLLITLDEKGEFHVFANVCRHRGHLLVENLVKGVRSLTCPYHAWCYGLDGSFIKAPFWDGTRKSEPDSEQKSNMGLLPVRFAVWYDIIFVNLSGDAEPFDQYIYSLNERWDKERPSSNLRCFSEKQYFIKGNWKLVAENFLDNYHLPWIHPEIGNSIETSIGLEVENLMLSKNIIGFTHPTAGTNKEKTNKSLPCWPNMDNSKQMQQDLFFIFPNTCLVMEGYYVWSMILLPNNENSCQELYLQFIIRRFV